MRGVKKALLLLFLLCMVGLPPQAGALPGAGETFFRLHIRANSDAPADQRLKHLVKNKVLKALQQQLQEVESPLEAELAIAGALPEILALAEATVRDAGFSYPVRAVLGEAHFPTRLYGDRVYRAGSYKALQLYLGEGRGENWWCVLFPPLCFAELPGYEPLPVVAAGQPPLRPKSRLLEWWRQWQVGGSVSNEVH